MNDNTRDAVPNIVEIHELPTLRAEASQLVQLEAECQALSRHLVGEPANSYVLHKYREAHTGSRDARLRPIRPFDRFQLRLVRRHALGARIVDTYAGIFDKRSIVRRKIILLLAILESCAPFAAYFDRVKRPGFLAGLAYLSWHTLAFSFYLLCAILLLLPAHAYYSLAHREMAREAAG